MRHFCHALIVFGVIAICSSLVGCGSGDDPSVGREGTTPVFWGKGDGKADSFEGACLATVKFGVQTETGPTQEPVGLMELEAAIGTEVDLVVVETDASEPILSSTFDRLGERALLVHLHVEPAALEGNGSDAVNAWFAAIAERQLYVRLMMNDGGPAQWEQAKAIADGAGATGVSFVWAESDASSYPGDELVDVIAIDGAGDPDQLADTFVGRYEAHAERTDKPIWLLGVGYPESRDDKAVWVEAMFRAEDFPRLDTIVWLETADLSVQSSPSTCAVFCRCLSGQSGDACLAEDACGQTSASE